ncbi:MAG: 4'-phosphopantetheinyl transferase family protein [Pseudonocardiaceae bacterium]
MIKKILPDVVASVEAFDDPPEAMLFPEEEAVVSRAVEKRRREFRTVRHCARLALGELGMPPVAVLPGERREPLWPPGIVGSMTHCAGYRAAAVARDRDLLSLGIDAEPHGPLPGGVLGAIALDEEQAMLADLTAVRPVYCWDRLLFCAKETVYKAWFPLTRRWLGFQDAAIRIDPAERTFSARLLVTGATISDDTLTRFDGRWMIDNGLVLTAIALEHPGVAGDRADPAAHPGRVSPPIVAKTSPV